MKCAVCGESGALSEYAVTVDGEPLRLQAVLCESHGALYLLKAGYAMGEQFAQPKTLTHDEYADALMGFGQMANAAGLPETDQAFALLLTALAIADKNTRGGCSREAFLRMSATVYDKLRRSLGSGERN